MSHFLKGIFLLASIYIMKYHSFYAYIIGLLFGYFIYKYNSSIAPGAAYLIKRKYLEVSFEDGGLKYDYFLPYSKIKSLNSSVLTGKTTGRVYRITEAAVPSISAKLLGEEAFIFEKNGQKNELANINEITF